MREVEDLEVPESTTKKDSRKEWGGLKKSIDNYGCKAESQDGQV